MASRFNAISVPSRSCGIGAALGFVSVSKFFCLCLPTFVAFIFLCFAESTTRIVAVSASSASSSLAASASHGLRLSNACSRVKNRGCRHRSVRPRSPSRPSTAVSPAMVQSINTKALLTLASVVKRPYLASPHVHVSTISEVNYEALRDKCGIRAVIFDKDNTLTAPYENETHPNAEVGLRNALDAFGRSHVAILSNSAGTRDDPGYEDAKRIERDMGLAVIRHDEKKPGGLDEVLAHFDGVDDASQLCMVGDRLLTDVVFGNLHGMLTIHTLPLCRGSENKNDNKIASVVRTAENGVLYGNWFGGRMVRSRTMRHAVWLGEDKCPLVLPPTSSTRAVTDDINANSEECSEQVTEEEDLNGRR